MGILFSVPQLLLNTFYQRLQRYTTAATPEPLLHSTAEEVDAHFDDQPRSRSEVNNDQSQVVAVTSDSYLAAQQLMGAMSGLLKPQSVTPSLFALIIGIDEYSGCDQLAGAVSDARAMSDYLKNVLKVDEDHIRVLFNSQATRTEIINACRAIRDDKRIKNKDPILIFYAGHGGELPAQHGWGLGGKIQCLIPSDYKPGVIHPIPDRTIGALVEEIAKAKGDNVTLIFDCCYSAGCTRDEDEEYVPRTVDLELNIPETLDKDILASRDGSVPDDFLHHGILSHVLLAACAHHELAYERMGHGQFTEAVLRALTTCVVDKITYADLIERVHLPKQHPQCEGINRHRALFDGRVSAARQVYRITQDDHKCVISAGLAHGVLHGVEFTLSNELMSRLGTVVVDDSAEIGDFETIITVLEAHLETASFARLTRVGKIPIYLAREVNSLLPLEETLLKMVNNRTGYPNVRLVEEAKEAKLELAMENGVVVFRILDQRLRRFGLNRLPRVATLDFVGNILAASAHYHWYLGLTNKDGSLEAIHRDVVVDFYPLKKSYDQYGFPFYTPILPGLCKKDPDSDSDIIEFVVAQRTCYGLEIKNNTQYDLHLNAFLFNSSSFSIAPYYTQSSVGTPEAPLKRDGSFTIGYGEGGTPPFTYWLANGQNVDVGILKIFFATKPVDLSDVVQMSPFAQGAHGRQWDTLMDLDERGAKLSVSKYNKQPRSKPVDVWFTVEIPIVQKRFAAV